MLCPCKPPGGGIAPLLSTSGAAFAGAGPQGILLTKMYFLLLNKTLFATVACLIAVSGGAITVGKAPCPQGVCLMKRPAPLQVRITLAFLSPPYLFLVIGAEDDNATVHPGACIGMQTDTTTASTIYISCTAILPLGLRSK